VRKLWQRGVAVGNKANGVGGVGGASGADAVSVGAGNASSGAVGAGKTSFVPKTNSSIALPSGLCFLVFLSTLPYVSGESQIIPQFTNAEKFKQN
jgi:hypothetical protein